MSYENSAACKMLATNCAVCARPLVDAVSVQVGIGPDCREKYGFCPDILTDEYRDEANRLIFLIAMEQTGKAVDDAVSKLYTMGFDVLARRIAKRLHFVTVDLADGKFTVKGPYSEIAVNALRNVPGRVWDKENKVNTYPEGSRGALWKALRIAYHGHTGIGPKGAFKIA